MIALWFYLAVGLALVVWIVSTDRGLRQDVVDTIGTTFGILTVLLIWPVACVAKFHGDRRHKLHNAAMDLRRQSSTYYYLTQRKSYISPTSLPALIDSWWNAEDLIREKS